MKEISKTFVMVDDSQLVMLIDTAQDRVAYIAPGITKGIATALVEKWKLLGAARVRVIIDTDPEVARLGYGTVEGLSLIHSAAREMGTMIHIQPGLRLGLVIIDNTAIVFSPIPQLIEAGSTTNFRPNGLLLDQIPPSIIEEIGWGEMGETGTAIGVTTATQKTIDQVKTSLEENPPQKFDIYRKVLVFNSRFEFVELSVHGCSFSRKNVRIPSDLLGFITDQKVKDRFQGTYKLIQDASKEFEREIHEKRTSIVDNFLISLPNYGMVILRKNKEKFLAEVNDLKKFVSESQKEIEKTLQHDIDESIDSLIASLLPGVTTNPPSRWLKFNGPKPTLNETRDELECDLIKAFGSPSDWVKAMEIKVIFKSVTYETLTDPNFQRVVRKAIPTLELIHDEYNAAPSLLTSLDEWR